MKTIKTKSKVKAVKLNKVRKPRTLSTYPKQWLSAGFFESSENRHKVYLGGSNYCDISQIHLTTNEVHRLSQWLSRASAYLKQNKGV